MQTHSVRRRKKASVRAWSAAGDRYPNKTLEEAEGLERDRFVVAHRDRHGVIIAITYLGAVSTKFQNRYQAGTKYSFRELDLPRPVWTLRELPWRAGNAATEYLGTQEEIDAHVRAMFLGVGRSVLAKAA